LNDFLNWATRWTVRIVLLMVGVVFFLSLLTVGCLLAALWGLRALWAKLTGQPVTPWVMPMRAASSWTSMYQRAGGLAAWLRNRRRCRNSAPLQHCARQQARRHPVPGRR